MVEVDLSIILAGLSIAASIIYYASVLRNANKTQKQQLETRQVQYFNQFIETGTSDEYLSTFEEILFKWEWTDFEDFMNKYGPQEEPEKWSRFRKTCRLWEMIGIYYLDNLINLEYVYQVFGSQPIQLWEKIEPVVLEYRERYETPPKGMMYEFFEDLYFSMRDLREKDRMDFAHRLEKREKKRATRTKEFYP